MRRSHWHQNRSWKSGGAALIKVGIVLLAILLLSLKQYILKKDIIGIILLSVLSLIFIMSGVFVKWWARKNGKN